MKSFIAIAVGTFLMIAVMCYGSYKYDKEVCNALDTVSDSRLVEVGIDNPSQEPGFIYFYYLDKNSNIEVTSINLSDVDEIELIDDSSVSVSGEERHYTIYIPRDTTGADRVVREFERR